MIYLAELGPIAGRKERSCAERGAAKRLLRWVMAKRLPHLSEEGREALLAVGPHGKPYLRGDPFYFNLSHSGGLVACAAEETPVGVDVEKVRSFSPALLKRICTPREQELVSACENKDSALTRLWTMKESYMKYTGLGFAQGILATEFESFGRHPRLCSGEGCFTTVELPGAFLTLCTREPVELCLEKVPEEAF